MGELADTVKGTFENGAGASALDICDNSDPASIVFMGRMIEPLSGGIAWLRGNRGMEHLQYFRESFAQEWESS